MVDQEKYKRSILPNPNSADPPPFEKMNDKAFEEMCCALLTKEPGVLQADLYGRPREPQFGVDIVGNRQDPPGIDVISCKCVGRAKRGELKKWSDDYLTHWDTHWKSQRVHRFILVVAADMKSLERRKELAVETALFASLGISYETWPPRLLQEKLRPHPALVAQYLGSTWVERICGPVGAPIADAKQLLEDRWTNVQAGNFRKAAACAEDAAKLAHDAGDAKTLWKALLCAASDLRDQLVAERLPDALLRVARGKRRDQIENDGSDTRVFDAPDHRKE